MDLKKWLSIMETYEAGGHAYHATMPTDSLKVFRDKFFKYMNIFRSLKYLNFVSEYKYPKESVLIGAYKLLDVEGSNYEKKDVFELLSIFRKIDKSR